MKNSFNKQPGQDLLKAIVALQNTEEAEKFLGDLLTQEEINEFSARWQVARMLSNNVPYSTIEEQTGMSSTTIARISKWLKKGMNGYNLIIGRLNHHHLAKAG